MTDPLKITGLAAIEQAFAENLKKPGLDNGIVAPEYSPGLSMVSAGKGLHTGMADGYYEFEDRSASDFMRALGHRKQAVREQGTKFFKRLNALYPISAETITVPESIIKQWTAIFSTYESINSHKQLAAIQLFEQLALKQGEKILFNADQKAQITNWFLDDGAHHPSTRYVEKIEAERQNDAAYLGLNEQEFSKENTNHWNAQRWETIIQNAEAEIAHQQQLQENYNRGQARNQARDNESPNTKSTRY